MLPMSQKTDFYEDNIDAVLRFGDVLEGYALANSVLSKPFTLLRKEDEKRYSLDVRLPKYCVVLTPCCNIEAGRIVLTPLIQLKGDMIKNDRLEGKYLDLNAEIEPYRALSDRRWNKLDEGERAAIKAKKKSYTYHENFVYFENRHFDEYKLAGRFLRYYMIDFTKLFYIKCELIKRDAKNEPLEIVRSKVLQLTKNSRALLRMKLATYYYRVPEEDSVESLA
jgi:hypothetical protein